MQENEQTILELMSCHFQTWEANNEMTNLDKIAVGAASLSGFHARFRDNQLYQKGVARLFKNLLDDHWGVVNGSAKALGSLGLPEAVHPLFGLKMRPSPAGGTVKEAETYRIIANALTTIVQKSAADILTPDLHALAEFDDLTEEIPTGWFDSGNESYPSGYKKTQIDCSAMRNQAIAELQRRNIVASVPSSQTNNPRPSVSGSTLESCPHCQARVMFISTVCPNCQIDRHKPVAPRPKPTATPQPAKRWWEFWR